MTRNVLIETLARRDFLSWVRTGLSGAAILSLLGRDGMLHADVTPGDAEDGPPHHPPRAKRAIHIFLCGGLSHVDSFDYKPELVQYHGKPLVSDERPDVFFGKV